MKVLIPVISGTENDPAFIDRASKGAKQIFILFVVEPSMMSSEISHGNAVINDIKSALGKKKKKCEDIMEWGDTTRKIIGIARLNSIGKVVLKGGVELSNQIAASLGNEKIPAEII